MLPMNLTEDADRRQEVVDAVMQKRTLEVLWSEEENRSLTDWVNKVRSALQDAVEFATESEDDWSLLKEYDAWAQIATPAIARMEILLRAASGSLLYVFELPERTTSEIDGLPR